jgi:hypothetical protein
MFPITSEVAIQKPIDFAFILAKVGLIYLNSFKPNEHKTAGLPYPADFPQLCLIFKNLRLRSAYAVVK